MFEEIFKRVLDKLTGADFWIALGFLAAGVICWLLMGTKTHEKKVRRKQIGIALLLGLVGGAAIWMNHSFFLREPVFSENVTGILVMRVVGDDALDSLQAALVENLNREVQEEAGNQWIEVHAGRDRLDDSNGLPAAHARAQIIGQRLNAKLVIWGRKIGEKEFYPYITVTATPENATASGATASWSGLWSDPFGYWSVKNERAAAVVHNIAELHLPKELEDEPFYLIHFAVGYSYYVQTNYEEALFHFKAALRRKGGSPSELADLQFFTASCEYSLAFGQQNMSANLQETIELYEKAAKGYEGPEEQNETKWAMTQNNLGRAYRALPTGDRAANLRKAIAAYEGALQVYTENHFPVNWATVQAGLGLAYAALPTGDRAANLQKAIAAYEAVLPRFTGYVADWAAVQAGLGFAYAALPTGDRAANLQKAITAYEQALRVYTEKDFPVDWAATQGNLGLAYSAFPTGDRAANLQKAIAACEAALRVYTEKDFPVDWAMTQNDLGYAYSDLPTGDRAANLRKAKVCLEAALRVYTESGFPEAHRAAAARLADVKGQLRNLTSE
jgi:tetratricopeptide (TPR) repeat protein